jgi:hypothetical protein
MSSNISTDVVSQIDQVQIDLVALAQVENDSHHDYDNYDDHTSYYSDDDIEVVPTSAQIEVIESHDLIKRAEVAVAEAKYIVEISSQIANNASDAIQPLLTTERAIKKTLDTAIIIHTIAKDASNIATAERTAFETVPTVSMDITLGIMVSIAAIGAVEIAKNAEIEAQAKYDDAKVKLDLAKFTAKASSIQIEKAKISLKNAKIALKVAKDGRKYRCDHDIVTNATISFGMGMAEGCACYNDSDKCKKGCCVHGCARGYHCVLCMKDWNDYLADGLGCNCHTCRDNILDY